MNTIRNKGCFSNLSPALLAFEFLLLCLLFLPLLIPTVWLLPLEKKKRGGYNIVIVIVLSVFELKMRLLLTCKYFRLN